MPLSKAPVPHFYVTAEVAMDRGMGVTRGTERTRGPPEAVGERPGHQAHARWRCCRNPGINASLQGQSIRVHHRAHIGLAVALSQGLITPVLRDCDVKPLAQIAVESRDLAERARGGKLRAPR